ncbi:hypothetical protein DM01DRAFT_1240079 [Hesseltinella vesiculosa]|uniref:F-box domain-containing protein n=1 Tax=Hesseltinella vesiculosa TaxID=101127 RepID=A0A1X2GMB7_9FUNG|nr:hypothetical protein DM01DRAFT_1240079 [Hesseltinella vesiculosa]
MASQFDRLPYEIIQLIIWFLPVANVEKLMKKSPFPVLRRAATEVHYEDNSFTTRKQVVEFHDLLFDSALKRKRDGDSPAHLDYASFVKRLDFGWGIKYPPIIQVTRLVQACTNLAHLNLYNCFELANMDMKAILLACPRLRILAIAGCTALRASFLFTSAVQPMLSRLQHLNITCNPQFFDCEIRGASHSVLSLPALTSLKMGENPRCSSSTLELFAAACVRLHTLEMIQCVLARVAFAFLAACPSTVTSLLIDGAYDMECFLPQLPALGPFVSLEFTNCRSAALFGDRMLRSDNKWLGKIRFDKPTCISVRSTPSFPIFVKDLHHYGLLGPWLKQVGTDVVLKDADLALLCQQCPQLYSLAATADPALLSTVTLATALTTWQHTMSHLEIEITADNELYFSRLEAADIPSAFPGLKSLAINKGLVEESMMTYVLSSCPKLEYLEISTCLFGPETLEELVNEAPCLRGVHLTRMQYYEGRVQDWERHDRMYGDDDRDASHKAIARFKRRWDIPYRKWKLSKTIS